MSTSQDISHMYLRRGITSSSSEIRVPVKVKKSIKKGKEAAKNSDAAVSGSS